jgi:hypothetical protein
MSRDLFPSDENCARLHDLYCSKPNGTLFIVCNGPSLNKMDLTLLRGHDFFLLNRGTMLIDRIGEWPTYWAAVNPYVIRDYGNRCYGELGPKPIKFMPKYQWANRKGWENTIWIDNSATRRHFFRDLFGPIREGHTITNIALQIAFHIGYYRVYLIGMDHRYQSDKGPNQLVTQEGPDRNHFDPNYFGPGTEWQMADLAMSEVSYGMAREAFEGIGCIIRDATVDGACTIFEKANFDEVARRHDA